MRYTKDHKQTTHERLVQTAAQQFRARGSAGVSIAELMEDLQLTHGGFYRHFASKDDLYARALDFSFAQTASTMTQAAQEVERATALQAVIERYLSLEHCANPADGCPVAALSAEMTHQPERVRAAFDQGLHAYIERLAFLLPGTTVEERQRNALALFSGMAGALMVARAVTDGVLQTTILEAARALYTRVYCA
jgi:TetR/AcrR family transcriptional repressor of nem operon